MHRQRIARIAAPLGLIGLVISGCSVASEPPTGLAASVSPPPSAPIVATSVPSATATLTASASAAPQELPSAESMQPDPTLTPPPDATLTVDGGDPVVGEQGTWSWNSASSDAPWLPGYPIHVGASERLTFTMAARVPIDTWRVSRVPPSSVPGGDGIVQMAEGTGVPISFVPPPPGRWSVSVEVTFGDGLGDAAYYWAVTVD